MKRLIVMLLFSSNGILFAQNSPSKPAIDFEGISNWTKLSQSALITDNGKYMAYFVDKGIPAKYNAVVASTDGKWQRELSEIDKNGTTAFIGSTEFEYEVLGKRFKLSLPGGKITRYEKNVQEIGTNNIEPFRISRNDGLTTIELFDKSSGEYRKVADDRLLRDKKRLRISRAELMASGNFLLTLTKVNLEEKVIQPIVKTPNCTIWSYSDNHLQSELNGSDKMPEPEVTALLFSLEGRIDVLDDDTHVATRAGDAEVWLLGRKGTEIKQGGRWGIMGYRIYDMVISTFDGKRKSLSNMDSVNFKNSFSSSSDGNYIGYFDPVKGFYYSYDLTKSRTHNLTPGNSGFSPSKFDRDSRPADIGKYGIQIISNKNGRLTVYDEFDIWEIDLKEDLNMRCLTNHWGRANDIVLRFLAENMETLSWNKDEVLVYGFGKSSKMNGLFSIDPKKIANPKKMFWENALWYNVEARFDMTAKTLLKARKADVLLLMRQTASDSPNWFAVTSRGSHQLSFVNPEKKFNWLKSQLVKWKSNEGNDLMGILYTPENFDPSVKYPVIVNYYESYSEGLHKFLNPGRFSGDLNIPWLVSRGYLVFRPDIQYIKGMPGQSSLECVENGVDEIIKLPFVDGNNIGLAGHSFGGFETLYIVTHSRRYKAALAAAPISNVISLAGRVNLRSISHGKSNQSMVEWSQGGIGASIWEKPELFVENSPIFNADKVSTPCLILHNPNDKAVPFEQGLEFFLAMHRLGKPAWMLSYDADYGHMLWNDDNQKDYTIRTTQFFDHYLKGAPAPLWMLEKTSYKDATLIQAYDLDIEGRKPGPSPNLDFEEYKKIRAYSRVPLLEKIMRMSEPKQDVNERN